MRNAVLSSPRVAMSSRRRPRDRAASRNRCCRALLPPTRALRRCCVSLTQQGGTNPLGERAVQAAFRLRVCAAAAVQPRPAEAESQDDGRGRPLNCVGPHSALAGRHNRAAASGGSQDKGAVCPLVQGDYVQTSVGSRTAISSSVSRTCVRWRCMAASAPGRSPVSMASTSRVCSMSERSAHPGARTVLNWNRTTCGRSTLETRVATAWPEISSTR